MPFFHAQMRQTAGRFRLLVALTLAFTKLMPGKRHLMGGINPVNAIFALALTRQTSSRTAFGSAIEVHSNGGGEKALRSN